jgi:hypothetical protein
MATAAAEPTVPGAHRERPQPNQVAMAKAILSRGELVIVRGSPHPRGVGIRRFHATSYSPTPVRPPRIGVTRGGR